MASISPVMDKCVEMTFRPNQEWSTLLPPCSLEEAQLCFFTVPRPPSGSYVLFRLPGSLVISCIRVIFDESFKADVKWKVDFFGYNDSLGRFVPLEKQGDRFFAQNSRSSWNNLEEIISECGPLQISSPEFENIHKSFTELMCKEHFADDDSAVRSYQSIREAPEGIYYIQRNPIEPDDHFLIFCKSSDSNVIPVTIGRNGEWVLEMVGAKKQVCANFLQVKELLGLKLPLVYWEKRLQEERERTALRQGTVILSQPPLIKPVAIRGHLPVETYQAIVGHDLARPEYESRCSDFPSSSDSKGT